MRRGTFVFVALTVSWLSLSPAGGTGDRPSVPGTLPRLMLWAWERPVDLRALDATVGVAFLSQTLRVRDGAVLTEPRRNPLRVSPATPLVAVTRIESANAGARGLSGAVIGSMASAIVGTASLPRVAGVQIDFDAAESEHAFYRALIHRVRRELAEDVPLSITALASWCAGDRWMSGLPIDEAVPMLFRMGPVHTPFSGIARSPSAGAAECRDAIGTSLDEPRHVRPSGRRVYVFNARPWTAASIAQAREVLD
jgi:hypothetical protein